MNSGRTIFAQLLDFLPSHEFRKCVARYAGNRRIRHFSCWDQFLCLAFAQLTYRESLRDIMTCLHSAKTSLYHSGFRGHLARSTLADANELRDWRIYADFAAVLIRRARHLYAQEPLAVDLDQTVYAFDSTTIDLCLTLFPWAQFRRRKSAVKLHTLIDLRGNIPCFVRVSGGRMADVTALDELPIEPAAVYVMDRGYTDFRRLYRFTQNSAYFIIRAKRDLDYAGLDHQPFESGTGVRSDQLIRLRGPKTSGLYPIPLRRIGYYAADIDKRFVFLTNHLMLAAPDVAELYRSRWQVELFFKWIKHHLRIKAFYGTTENAVKVQVWTAVSVYALAAIVKKEMGIQHLSLGEMLQILSICPFQKMPLLQAFSDTSNTMDVTQNHNQLRLFDL
jgi:hypothetical protein